MRARPPRVRAAWIALALLAALDAARSAGVRWLLAAQEPSLAGAPAPASRDPGPPDDPRRERGRYLVESGLCGHCHTPVSPDGAPLPGLHLAGGMRFAVWPFGVFASANLTGDPETGVGRLDEAEIAAAIRRGHTPERALDTIVMPSVVYASVAEEDARAMARYLRSLPPVANAAPLPVRYGAAETLAGKLLFLAGAIPAQQVIAAGNLGRPRPEAGAGARLLGLLPWLQLAVLAAVLARWRPRGARGALAAALLLPVLAAGWLLYRFPAIPGVSAETLRARLFPEPALSAAAGRDGATLRRGRAVYFGSGCAVCHGMDGAERIELRWRGFGRVHTPNLTPHATGLGGRSDAEIERALRAGQAGDGRRMHGRAMPWPRFAALAGADVRALVAYLRALPPVACPRVPPRPPAPDDPRDLVVTFDAAAACRG